MDGLEVSESDVTSVCIIIVIVIVIVDACIYSLASIPALP